ncbi:MAG TPA: histidine kinase dimerization/phosphoacceptor domain -containing protein [Rhizobiaceae bacterium]|nr:histidine kinase dimerization/phosphoacceptor domain -containing protein [Rhizobiaceae bacterium]
MNDKPTKSSAHDWHMTDDLHAPQGKADPFAAAMRATRMAMIITDPKKPDNPIIFANDAFLRLTGYERSEVVGSNCRFLQGKDTDPDAVAALRKAVEKRKNINIDILNYRKDGKPFWNALYLSPVSDEQGNLQYFFGSQLDVTNRKSSELHAEAERERFERAVKERTRELEDALEARTMLLHEVDHRVKNNLQMISSLILMQSRNIQDEGVKNSLRSMLERVEALSTVHRRLYQTDDVTHFDVGDFVRDLVRDLVAASGRDDIEAAFQLGEVEIPAQQAAPVALIVNELVTNAIKHAFVDGRPGTVGVKVAKPDGHYRFEVNDNGAGMPPDIRSGSFGTTLVRALARQLEAKVSWESNGDGTKVVVTMPVEKGSPKEKAERL